ncbi:hypothetical protein TRAPUB_5537 [Trametes pubescens]|uniref:Uncharacterized protein n=1 Tax=Trametes pubescens TaxID=154538 RepID=A0A1M2V877_TRAPU|nr:hypothetical protein TRAPUB_5537 [Trametes pubescens]
MDVAPRTNGGMQPFRRTSPSEEGWKACSGHLQAFLNVSLPGMSGRFPATIRSRQSFTRQQSAAA